MNNLITRSLSGLVFLAIMIGGLWYGNVAFWIISCFVVAVGTWEFLNMLLPNGSAPQKCASIYACVALVMILPAASIYEIWRFSFSYSYIIFIIPISFPFAILAIFIAELYTKSEKPFVNIALYILPIIYIAAPFALMLFFMAVYSSANLMLLAFFIIIWANDVGAYCVGCTLGKKINAKLFPRISPNKSWAGFFGGFVFAMLAGALCANFMLHQPIIHWMIIGAIASVFGTFGDLVESMLKRSVGVKDSGKIMPGHGGILDRFDAVLLAFPPVFVYMICFLIYGF